MSVTTTDADGSEDRELDHRALTEYMTVLDDGDVRARSAPDLFTVTTQSGREYLVDVRVGACECPDHEYRDRTCKHLRRTLFATGRREIPEWIDPDAVDPQLGIHVRDGVAEADGDDGSEDDRGRQEPTRSEPADFGGGDSTGVQDL